MLENILAGLLLLAGLAIGIFGLYLRDRTSEGEADVGSLHFFPNDWKGIEALALILVALALWILLF